MEKPELNYFISGLKAVIRSNWATQEKFAEGVTSKVNLSNILRGNSGTSLEMRQKLASKAGMSVSDIIAVGKGTLDMHDKNSDVSVVITGTVNEHNYMKNLTTTGLSDWLNSYTAEFTDQCTNIAKHTAGILSSLVQERNRLQERLDHVYMVSHSMEIAVKIMDKDLNIVYCNETHTDRYGQVQGSKCLKDKCPTCNGDCLVSKVFATGQPVQVIEQHDGTWFFRRAYPVFILAGKLKHALVTSVPLGDLPAMLEASGLSKDKNINS